MLGHSSTDPDSDHLHTTSQRSESDIMQPGPQHRQPPAPEQKLVCWDDREKIWELGLYNGKPPRTQGQLVLVPRASQDLGAELHVQLDPSSLDIWGIRPGTQAHVLHLTGALPVLLIPWTTARSMAPGTPFLPHLPWMFYSHPLMYINCRLSRHAECAPPQYLHSGCCCNLTHSTFNKTSPKF